MFSNNWQQTIMQTVVYLRASRTRQHVHSVFPLGLVYVCLLWSNKQIYFAAAALKNTSTGTKQYHSFSTALL